MIPIGMVKVDMMTVTGPRGRVAKVVKVVLAKVVREAALVGLAKVKRKGEAAATTGGVPDFKMYISTGSLQLPVPICPCSTNFQSS